MAEEKKQTIQEMQEEILRVELETKQLGLEEARAKNAAHREKEARRREGNKKRMAELEAGRKQHDAVVKECRHKSGGTPKNILRGGGIGSFSLISRHVMPDGVTEVLQCPRCRMVLFPPTDALKKANPKQYAKDKERYDKLYEEAIENGLEHAVTRGPTFVFKNAEGVPIIPERV